MQRQVMRDKLERFSELERENVSLRNRNQLLVETAANSAICVTKNTFWKRCKLNLFAHYKPTRS